MDQPDTTKRALAIVARPPEFWFKYRMVCDPGRLGRKPSPVQNVSHQCSLILR